MAKMKWAEFVARLAAVKIPAENGRAAMSLEESNRLDDDRSRCLAEIRKLCEDAWDGFEDSDLD